MKTQTGIIPFQGTKLVTALVDDVIYIAMKPFVEAMGLAWQSQSEKIKSDERYHDTVIPYKTNGGMQEMLSLTAYQLPAYLYSINPNKVRKDLRDRIIAFQSETFKVINEYWHKGYAINENRFDGKNINHIINGYKSQISQHNKNIEELKLKNDRQLIVIREQTKTLEYLDNKLKNEKNLKEENQELRKALANITKVLDIKDNEKVKPRAHNNILELIYQFHCHMYELNAARRSIDERIHHLNTFITSLKKSYPESEKYIEGLEERAKNRSLNLNLRYEV